MEFDVQAAIADIDFAPGTTEAEVLQNIRTIITTTKYSVPLNRGFGVSASYLDSPIPVAQAKLTTEIIEEIKRLEPRAMVTQVTYTGDPKEGVLRPRVRVRLVGST